MLRSKLIILLMLVLWLVAGVACNSSGCLENRNSVPLAGFYSSEGTAITMDSVQITGLGMPESDPLSAAGEKISTIYLPMRSTEPSTGWVFSYRWSYLNDSRLNDTINFVYTSTPYFSSNDCGVIYKYLITEMTYTTHLLDSVVIVDSLITNVDIERIKIYFRTATDDDEDSSSDSSEDDDSTSDDEDSTSDDDESSDDNSDDNEGEGADE